MVKQFEANVEPGGYGSLVKLDGVEVPNLVSFNIDVHMNGARLSLVQLAEGQISGTADVTIQQPVCVGDTMRFSAPLLQQIHDAEGHLSEFVKVVEVRVEEDGSKTVVVERVDRGRA